jgi:hypothetical protein
MRQSISEQGMKVHRFLPAFAGRRIVETAVLVRLYALESIGACSKLTQALKMPEEANLYQT